MTTPVPHLFLVQGPRRRARLLLEGGFFVIGRAEPLPIFQDDPTISRSHLVVVATPDGVRVKDLGARNGALLNGRPLGRYEEAPLAPGDELRVGSTRLRLLPGREQEAASEGELVTVGDPGAPLPAVPAEDGGPPDPGDEDELEGELTAELSLDDGDAEPPGARTEDALLE